jgi:hypothetical protein
MLMRAVLVLAVALLVACNLDSPAGSDGRFNANLSEDTVDAGLPAEPAANVPNPHERPAVAPELGSSGPLPERVVPNEGHEGEPASNQAPDAAVAVGVAEEEGPPPIPLRAAAIGELPIFDPSSIYIVGDSGEIADYGTFGVAPLDSPADSVASFGWFAALWIRRGDGHLIYQEDGSRALAREMRRDPMPMTDQTLRYEGETTYSTDLPCGEADPLAPRFLLLSWDDALYHTCGNGDPGAVDGERVHTTWYTADGQLAYSGDARIVRIGPNQRALGVLNDALVVIDLATGEVLNSIELDGGYFVAVRMHAEGFMLALIHGDEQTTDNNREQLTGRSWLDLDLDGNIVATGTYAPLLQGYWYVGNGNAWGQRVGVLDPQGQLYEFVGDPQGGEVVVMRRPRTGVSDVRFVQPDGYEPGDTNIHAQVPRLLTGG